MTEGRSSKKRKFQIMEGYITKIGDLARFGDLGHRVDNRVELTGWI